MQTEQPNPFEISADAAARLRGLCTTLPAIISVPSPDGDDDGYLRPLMSATVAELRLALDAIWKSIARDSADARALQDLLDLALQTGADDDTRVTEALERPSAGETPA